MPSDFDIVPATIDRILARIESLLLETWQETGFGYLEIESDREKGKIIVLVKAGTYYRYTLTDEEVSRWVSRKSS